MSNIPFLPVAASEKAQKLFRLIAKTNCKVRCSRTNSVSVHILNASLRTANFIFVQPLLLLAKNGLCLFRKRKITLLSALLSPTLIHPHLMLTFLDLDFHHANTTTTIPSLSSCLALHPHNDRGFYVPWRSTGAPSHS